MRIISKFHDYYDSVQSIGYDPDLVYLRRQSSGIISDVGWRDITYDMPFGMPRVSKSFIDHVRCNVPLDFTLFLVGFCGKYYLGGTHSIYDSTSSNIQTFYDPAQAHEYFLKYQKSKKQKTEKYSVLDKLGESSINPFNDPIEPFRAINAPCFVVPLRNYARTWHTLALRLLHNRELTINPCLADYQFYKLFDSYTAYQEIAMFLSGVLGWPENATVDISDTDMRNAKGFDEWSFKTPPTKKR